MAMYPVAGSKIYIGNNPIDEKSVDFVEADFSAVTWTEIKKWTTMGSIGDSAQLITSEIISEQRTKKIKGTRNAGSMQNVFNIEPNDPGQLALIAAEARKDNYPFRIVANDALPTRSFVTTMTIASPGVHTKVAHGLSVGDTISYATTGALPTGLVPGTPYYVKTVPDADTFTLSATPGGAAIANTGTQSGVHTLSTVPTNSERLFIALVMMSQETGGSANTVSGMNATLEINSNIVRVPRTGS